MAAATAAAAAAAALQLAQAPQRHKLTRLLIFSSSEQAQWYQQSGLELLAPASSVNSRAIIVHLVFLSLPETAGENHGEAGGGGATCSGLSGGMVAVTNVCCCCSLLDKMEFHRLAII